MYNFKYFHNFIPAFPTEKPFNERIHLTIRKCFFLSDKPLMVVAKTLYDYVMEEGAQQKNRLYM
jgi:hypothetical protein